MDDASLNGVRWVRTVINEFCPQNFACESALAHRQLNVVDIAYAMIAAPHNIRTIICHIASSLAIFSPF
jgi:hypothetical protein